jgi:transposase
MSPRYGRAYGKERAKISAPYNRGNHITMIGAISIFRVEAALYGLWPADGTIFAQFLQQRLFPILDENKVVVMDNVKFHKSKQVEEIIAQSGAKLIYLPPYSPELNPIEEMWSKVKILLRKQVARTMEIFHKAIRCAFTAVTNNDLHGWFTHAGY